MSGSHPHGPNRLQKRWAGRLRTAGALLLMTGLVALVDRVLPGTRDPLLMLPARAQFLLGVGAIATGGALFGLGKKWL